MYYVKSVVGDYGIFHKMNGQEKLIAIMNSNFNAKLVTSMLNYDEQHDGQRVTSRPIPFDLVEESYNDLCELREHSKSATDALYKESVTEYSDSDTIKTYNSISTASNMLTIDETGLFISFYNEDEQGNESDTVTVHLSVQKAQSLLCQLQAYLNDKRNKVYHNKSAKMDLFSDNGKEQTTLTEEHGYLVEYGKIYTAKREADGVEVKGYRVFSKHGISESSFEGLLSLDKVVLWSVTWDSLCEVTV